MIESSAINKEAQRLANELLLQATKNELAITADLQIVAAKVSAQIIGLENKFKTAKSLTRKLIDKSYGDLQKLPKAARTINDALRYTFILPIENYAESVRQTIEELCQAGYQVPEDRIWNAWQNIRSAKDRGYRGINITVISSQSQKFELQFHTKESYQFKTETHLLYEELRNKGTTKKRKIELINIFREAASKIEKPDGV